MCRSQKVKEGERGGEGEGKIARNRERGGRAERKEKMEGRGRKNKK